MKTRQFKSPQSKEMETCKCRLFRAFQNVTIDLSSNFVSKRLRKVLINGNNVLQQRK